MLTSKCCANFHHSSITSERCNDTISDVSVRIDFYAKCNGSIGKADYDVREESNYENGRKDVQINDSEQK